MLEGGGIDVDGEGTVIASEATLLNPNRNPDMTREQVEEVLIEYLGVQQVIWLGEGLQDDMTGGQIGNINAVPDATSRKELANTAVKE